MANSSFITPHEKAPASDRGWKLCHVTSRLERRLRLYPAMRDQPIPLGLDLSGRHHDGEVDKPVREPDADADTSALMSWL